jgi:hypothetical protein
VLAALAGCDDVTLDGVAVRASAAPVGFVGRLEDDSVGFRLIARRDPRVVETFAGEVALTRDGTLCPLGASLLSGRELAELQRGRTYRADEAAELVTEVLPSLRERIPLEIATDRLPRTTAEPPRIAPATRATATPRGAAAARLRRSADRASTRAGSWRSAALPLRDEAAGARCCGGSSRAELAPGRRQPTGGDALALAERLRRWGGAVSSPALAASRASARSRRASIRARARRSRSATPRAARGARRPRACSMRGARARAGWRSTAADSRSCPPTGSRATARASPICSPHAERVAKFRRPRCPSSPRSEMGARAQRRGAARCTLALADRRAPVPDALPADSTAVLRGYQSAGGAGSPRRARSRWARCRRPWGSAAAGVVRRACRTLVVAPTSVVPNWAAEAARFRPALRTCVYHGPTRALDPSADLTLTSYALLRLDTDALCAVDWDSVVLDESQAIKNADSQVARAAHRLPGRFRIALTGTPIENRLAELEPVPVPSRGWLGSQRDFDERYTRPIAAGDADAAARLRARVKPFVLRRQKRDVAPELPPRTESVLHVELAADERHVYDAIRAATRDDVAARYAEGGGAFQVLEALLRLRQAACDASLVPGARIERAAKLDVLRENLPEAVAEGHKALVFSQWTSLLDRVEPVPRGAETRLTRLDGATRPPGGGRAIPERERSAGAARPRRRRRHRLEPHRRRQRVHSRSVWNSRVEQQAADRAHRIGQTRPGWSTGWSPPTPSRSACSRFGAQARARGGRARQASAPAIRRSELLSC